MMEGQASVSGIGQINNVVSLNNNTTLAAVNGSSLAGLTAVPTAVTVPVSTMQTVQGLPAGIHWYNYTADGVGQLVSAGTPTVQVELAGNSDIARQFNQQVQAQYGHIQVALVPASAAQQQQHIQQQIIPIQIQQPIQIHQQPPQQQQQQQIQLQQQVQQLDPNVKMEQEVFIGNMPSSNTREAETTKKNRVKAGTTDRSVCQMCNKTVSCVATLRDHMRTHTGERPFSCSECGLAFSQRSNLRMHKRLHTGERPYMCGICGKTFARSSHLPAHMRTHTGEKPFVCNECDHAFITAQQLKNHHRVHTGEKPWKCDLCNAAFTHSSSLSTHKKKHTGNKPYQCDKCSKKFFFTSALDKHMKVHTKNRPFKCTTCDNTFKYKESLTVHVERYCGRQTEKKPRAPRKPDAKKPGPKPGTGRKYVQQRKGRPRGRPRKKGRFGKRGKKPKSEPKPEALKEEPPSEVLGIRHEVLNENVPDMLYQTRGDEEDLEDDNIPIAELKVESIEGTNETRVVMEPLSNEEITTTIVTGDGSSHSLSGDVMSGNSSISLSSVSGIGNDQGSDGDRGDNEGCVVIGSDDHHHQHHHNQHHQSHHHLSQDNSELAANLVHLDPSTSLTIVTAEEAERQMATGAFQVLTLPADVLQLMQNSHSQIISAEQLQQHLQQQQLHIGNHQQQQQQQHQSQHVQMHHQPQHIQVEAQHHQLQHHQQVQNQQHQVQHLNKVQQLQQQHHQATQQQQQQQQHHHQGSLNNTNQRSAVPQEHVNEGLQVFYTQ